MKSSINPLQGCRILVTRASEQSAELIRHLQERGAIPLECPTIRLVPPANWDCIDAAIQQLTDFDWLILTSVNGVRFFFARMQELGISPSVLQDCKICAVGPKTAEELKRLGIIPAMMPEQFTGEGVVAAFARLDLQGRRILFPKADGARDLIPQRLRDMGAVVDDPVVYRNVLPASLPEQARMALEQHQLDAVIFSSPSTVRNLAVLVGGGERLRELMSGLCVASIGPVSSKACQDLGLEVTVEAAEATLDRLIQALEQHYS